MKLTTTFGLKDLEEMVGAYLQAKFPRSKVSNLRVRVTGGGPGDRVGQDPYEIEADFTLTELDHTDPNY